MSTASEQLFEALCNHCGLVVSRVDVAAKEGMRRPDYLVMGANGQNVVTEVKQFDPNEDELAAEALRRANKVVVTGGEPGQRMREAFSDANAQIKALGRSECPGLLVVYRHPYSSRHHTDPYSILTAMRGLDVVPVRVPTDPHQPPIFLPVRPGPKGRLTEGMNRSVSAVGVLEHQGGPDSLRLVVYHNRHARVALEIGTLPGPRITHWFMNPDRDGWLSEQPVA